MANNKKTKNELNHNENTPHFDIGKEYMFQF